MPDNDTTSTQNEPPKVASLGATTLAPKAVATAAADDTTNTGADDGSAAAVIDSKNDEGQTGTGVAATFTDDQLKEYFKSQGIEYEGVEKLKEKLKPKVASTELTDEQKTEAAKAREKRVLDLFIANGGTAEKYVAIKGISEADEAILSLNILKEELKAAGFTDDETAEIIKERYYQMEDDAIEQLSDETDKAFAKRKKEYGAKKLATRSSNTKTQAAGVIADLFKAIESEDLQKQTEQTISANIDEQFSKIPRKSTFEIGEINGKPIPPIESEVPEKDLTEIQELFKDPAKRNNFFQNTDGSLNITNAINILSENAQLKAALKVAYHEAGNRQVEIFKKTFSGNGYTLGVGGAPNTNGAQKGKVASMGQPQRAKPTPTR